MRSGRRRPLRCGSPPRRPDSTWSPDPGGAAFYGPKISVQARDAIGRTWQMSTIQVDFQLPQRFDLEYQAADGSRQRPVMIHRALFGSIERFFGVLTEHYAGAFPPWLAPVQVVGDPDRRRARAVSRESRTRLREQGIRVEVDTSDDRMQKKIRNAQKQKVPFMLLAGDDDVAAGAVSFRYRSRRAAQRRPGRRRHREIVEAVRHPGPGVTSEEPRPASAIRTRSPERLSVWPAPDGVHQGRGQAIDVRRRRRLPVLPHPDAA